MNKIAIRIRKLIQRNFGNKELDFAEKLHLCSLIEEEFDINVDFFPNEDTQVETIISTVVKSIGENDAVNY